MSLTVLPKQSDKNPHCTILACGYKNPTGCQQPVRGPEQSEFYLQHTSHHKYKSLCDSIAEPQSRPTGHTAHNLHLSDYSLTNIRTHSYFQADFQWGSQPATMQHKQFIIYPLSLVTQQVKDDVKSMYRELGWGCQALSHLTPGQGTLGKVSG